MNQECQLDTLAWVSMACEHIRDFRFPVSDSHLSGNALAFQWLTSQERDSVLFLRDSRVIFASAEESSAWTIWPLNSRYVSSATDHGRADVYVFLVVAFFFFFFGHERVYLCVRPQFKAICDHKQYVCGAIFKQWLDYWCVTDLEIIVGIHKRRASFHDRLPLFNNIRSWRAVLKMMFARFFREE